MKHPGHALTAPHARRVISHEGQRQEMAQAHLINTILNTIQSIPTPTAQLVFDWISGITAVWLQRLKQNKS